MVLASGQARGVVRLGHGIGGAFDGQPRPGHTAGGTQGGLPAPGSPMPSVGVALLAAELAGGRWANPGYLIGPKQVQGAGRWGRAECGRFGQHGLIVVGWLWRAWWVCKAMQWTAGNGGG